MQRVLWLSLLLAVPVLTQSPKSYAASPCESAISSAELSHQLPAGLLHAVAVVESGRPDPRTGQITPWPWTIDVAGQGFFFPSKAAAIAAVEELRAAGISSIDVGCMQVNLMYHPAAFASLQQAFDPFANARYAASFLNALYYRSLDWTKAVGDYHSQTPTIAAPYQVRVLAQWRPPFGTVRRYAAFLPANQIYQGFRSWEQLARDAHSQQQFYVDAQQKAYESAPDSH